MLNVVHIKMFKGNVAILHNALQKTAEFVNLQAFYKMEGLWILKIQIITFKESIHKKIIALWCEQS